MFFNEENLTKKLVP